MPDHDLHAVPDEPTDPFDVDKLRATGLDDIGIERVTLAIAVRKPKRTEFFRTHPDTDAYWLDTFVLERDVELEREIYLVVPGVRSELIDELRSVRLITCMSKGGTVFLWPAKLPTEDARGGRLWAETALQIAEAAKTHWVRMVGRSKDGYYDMFRAVGDLGEPDWPDKPLKELLRLAFRGDRLIDGPNHPVLRELAGEI
jgi:hypothetical protein